MQILFNVFLTLIVQQGINVQIMHVSAAEHKMNALLLIMFVVLPMVSAENFVAITIPTIVWNGAVIVPAL
jgi:hypothetical protein